MDGILRDVRDVKAMLNPPLGFAHRGASAHAPENTIEAFRLAIRLGATGLESDVWITRDQQAVLRHDGALGMWPFGRKVETQLRKELPGSIPTLDELYGECGSEFPLSLDLKDAAAVSRVIEIAHEAGPKALENLWLCHPSLEVVASWRGLDDSVHLIHSTRLRKLANGPEHHAATLVKLGVDGVNLHHEDWSSGLTTLYHRFGRVAFAWDLQHEHQLVATLRMGVDAVYSDHVERMTDAISDHLDHVSQRQRPKQEY